MTDEQQISQTNQTQKNSAMLPVAIIAIMIIGTIAYFAVQSSTQPKTKQQETMVTTSPEPQTNMQFDMVEESSTQYKDGTYTAVGSYSSPAGIKEIEVSVTLENGVITETNFSSVNPDPVSTRFQNQFAEAYKPLVVGKNIDEVRLDKVSGSSLTPKGFNDALEKIKNEARS